MRKNRAKNAFRESQKKLAVDRAKALSLLVKKYPKEFKKIIEEIRK